jgi:hypothetical protein
MSNTDQDLEVRIEEYRQMSHVERLQRLVDAFKAYVTGTFDAEKYPGFADFSKSEMANVYSGDGESTTYKLSTKADVFIRAFVVKGETKECVLCALSLDGTRCHFETAPPKGKDNVYIVYKEDPHDVLERFENDLKEAEAAA